MTLPSGKKLKVLYMLALFQLVAGPLMLLQVTVFCKLAVPEISRVGMVRAAGKAFQSEEFHAVLKAAEPDGKSHTSPLPFGSKEKMMKEKVPLMVWQGLCAMATGPSDLVLWTDWSRQWTPAWPLPPPGPPPRVG